MRVKKIAIIGGGCCGLLLSNLLRDCGLDITIFEKNNKLGKKILASGNGKCNLTNVGDYVGKYNDGFANKVIEKFDSRKTVEYLESLGLICKADFEGRCYPVSECSSSVLDILKIGLKDVRILLECVVKDIKKEVDGYVVTYNDRKKESFDYVVCCSGSAASNLGNLKAYEYFSSLGINITDLRPSLTPLKVKEDVKELKGTRVKCLVKLIDSNHQVVYEEFGEVMFKEDALSGIAIFNCSNYINRKKDEYKIELDLSGGLSKDFLRTYLNSKKELYPNVFTGFLNDKLAKYIMKNANKNYSDNSISNIIDNIFHLSFNVIDMYSLVESQVCHGGIDLNEINDNLELKKYPNIYIGGELLDVDGVCGGYNMQFAWSSAGVIANNIKSKLGVCNNGK